MSTTAYKAVSFARADGREDSQSSAIEHLDVLDFTPSFAFTPGRELKPGDVIEGRYRVVAIIGRGGYATVYQVEQLISKKTFALKALNPMTSNNATMRFWHEAQAASRLEHPNLVHAFDFGIIEGLQPFLVMECVNGPTLAELLEKRVRLPVDSALQILIPICAAVAYAHGDGIIHRDIKPTNIILASEESGAYEFIPKLFDFGIARVRYSQEASREALTKTGEVFGTPLYMSPEQCGGTQIDHRSDIYALGCVLFEALTGSPPYSGAPLETMMQHHSAPIPSLREGSLGIEFPESLEQVVAKLLAKNPSDRYQSCADLIDDLELIQRGDFHRVSERLAAKPEQGKGEQVLKAGVVAACVIAITCGAAFYSSLNLVKRPLPGLQLDAETSMLQKMDLYDRETAADKIVNVFRYFSNEQNDERRKMGEPLLFNFPQKSSVPLGIVHYWDGRDVTAGAEGVKVFPAKAQLILESQDPNVPPCVMAHFLPTDLCGVWLKSPFRNLPVDDFLGQVCLLDGLQIFVTDATMSDRAFNRIGQLRHLRWLGLNGCRIHPLGSAHRRVITGVELAALPNIGNLRVLQSGEVCEVTTLLRTLAEKPALKRFHLYCVDRLTQVDCRLLGRITTLETLAVDSCAPPAGLLDELAKLPRLDKLCLRTGILTEESVCFLRKLKHLRHLEIFECADAQHRLNERRWIEQYLPAGFNKADLAFKEGEDSFHLLPHWFDPTREDLIKSGIVDKSE